MHTYAIQGGMCVREHKNPGLALANVCLCIQGGMCVREHKNPGLATPHEHNVRGHVRS